MWRCLALPHDNVRIFIHLTPLRSREVVVFADSDGGYETAETLHGGYAGTTLEIGDSRASTSISALADALHTILRNLIDVQGMRAFNLGIAFPPLRADGADWDGFPIVARLADRGDPLASSSDLGAIEFYATGCITADPFQVAAALQNDDRG